MLKKLVVYDNRDFIIFQCFLENGMRYEENRFEDGTLNSIYLYCDDKFIGTLTAYKGRVELKNYIKTENYEYKEMEGLTW